MFTEHQKAVIRECAQATHTIWTAEHVKTFSERLGFHVPCRTFVDQPTVPKGAHLSGGRRKMEGLDSEGVLETIASHLGYRFQTAYDFTGRGFRVSAMAHELMALDANAPAD